MDITPDLVSACAAAHEWERVMTILQVLPQVSLAGYFPFSETNNLLLAEEAAKRSGEGLVTLGLYNSAAKYLASLKLPAFDNYIAELNIMAA